MAERASYDYDVFLNFHGEDTNSHFISNLYTALGERGATIFPDDVDLRKAESIEASLGAIHKSRTGIIIFSENYASSVLCLDELVQIIKCLHKRRMYIWSVSYHVDPLKVRNLCGTKAFAKHRERFKEDRIEKWLQALKEATYYSSYFIPSWEPDRKCIEEIIGRVTEKLEGLDLFPSHVVQKVCCKLGSSEVVDFFGGGKFEEWLLDNIVCEADGLLVEIDNEISLRKGLTKSEVEDEAESQTKTSRMLFIEWEFKLRMKQILHNLEDLTSHFSNLGLKEAGGTEIKSESEYRPMPPIMTIQPAISHFSKAPSRFLKFKGSTSMKPPKAPSKARLFKFGKGSPSMNPPKAPSPKAVSGRVLGREKEKDQVVDFLQYLSCNENTVTSILGLVGPGGIGKTTLARLVYEDDKVRKSFQLRVWVTFPSYQLEAKTLAKIILIKLKVSFNQDDQLADLLTLLRKNSSGKKLLLVLDGCWSVREWEEVRNCFESAARGSAIILTTRTTKAALQMLVDDILHVSFLSDEHCFSLFSDHCIRSSYYTLDRKKIVSKCGGVPLAAKMLGGLLCEKLREESTTSLGEMWESKEWKYSDIYLAKPFVRLCYRYLSVPLRRCIAYLATFHKGCQFQKSHVVRDWIDDGLIESRDDESMERLGNKYFDSLVARSFLIRSNSGGEAVFTMHDMVRDFALAVYENSQFRFEENDESNLIKNIQNAEESSSELYEPQMEEYTPLNPNITHGLDHQSPEIDVKLPTTTTDDVVQPSFESETDFDTLRIWDSSNLKELPPKLHSLRIEDCRTFKSLQDVLMGRSTNLYELFIIRCPFLQYFTHKPCPTSLKTLYVHECRKLEFLRSLEKMQNFKFLESLFIGSSCNTLKTFPMTHFPKLKILCIWDCPNLESLSIEGRKKNVLALESLEIRDCSNLVSFPATGILFPYLRSFLVSNCKKIKSLPTPMSSLTSLQSVFVIKCPELESLPEGGLPSCLKQLSIAFCDKLIPRHNWKLQGLQCLQRFEIESGCMGLKSFPEKSLLRVNLNSLYISKLTSLEIWDHHALQQLTALQSLEINCCENLKSLPEFLPSSLTFLAIKESPLLSRKLLDQSSTHWHKIAHISNIQIDNNVISKNGELSDSFVSRYSIPVTANTKRTSYDQSKDSKFSINKMEEGALEPKRMPHGAPVGESF